MLRAVLSFGQLRRTWDSLMVRKLGLVLIVLLSINTFYVGVMTNRVRHEVKSLHTENQTLRSDVKQLNLELRSRLEDLSEIPLAFAETPKGLKIVPAAQGASRSDLAFLSRFRGSLISDGPPKAKFKPAALDTTLRSEITKEFASDSRNLQLRPNERQALIAFSVLRTNGSMPTYEVRPAVPNNLEQLVAGTSGNCSDYSLRLMMVLESLGIKAAVISSVTKNIGGHVVVDAYDPLEDTAYLLDANFNVMIVKPNSKGRGFIEMLLVMSDDERIQYAESADITAFPVYVRFVDPGTTGLKNTPLTPDYINEHRHDREPMWRRWMSHDTDQLVDWWKRTPNHAPKTLREFASFLSVIPAEFDVSGDYAGKLRKVAGVNLPRAGQAKK